MSKTFESLRHLERNYSLIREIRMATDGERARRSLIPAGGRAGEEVEKLVAKLYILPGSPAPQLAVFSPLEAGGGNCTWVCAQASDVLASSVSMSVCLVDAGSETSALHEYLGVACPYGWADLVRNPRLPIRGALARLPGGNLWLLSTGSAPLKSLDADDADRFCDRLDELRSCFDFILVNGLPIGSGFAALLLEKMADGVVVVLRAHSESRDAVRRCTDELAAAGVTIIGAVLTDRTFPIPDAVYRRL